MNPHWLAELTKELSHRGPAAVATIESAQPPPPAARDPTEPSPWQPPEVATKQLVATRRPWASFGPLVATHAWHLGFFLATRRAFLGDGAETNWTLWRQYFSSFVPILDFIHALTYVYHAALAGRAAADGWQTYTRWIGWVWSGAVDQTIVELVQRQAELGVPAADAKATSPAKLVARALVYLQHNRSACVMPTIGVRACRSCRAMWKAP